MRKMNGAIKSLWNHYVIGKQVCRKSGRGPAGLTAPAYFKLLLECQFFPEIFKQVSGSFNDYVDIGLLNMGHFFLWGGWGDISRYSKVFVRLEFPLSRTLTLLPLFGRISRCTESISLI